MTQDLGAPVSLRLNGNWNRSLAGTSLTSKPIYWHTSAGNYELLSGVTQNPAVSNATGQWLFSGTSLAFSATSDPLSFSASVGTIAFDLIDNNSLSLVATGGAVGTISGAAGDWTRSGLDTKTWANDPNNPRGFTYENGTRNIEFLEWGGSVIRFRETRSDGTLSLIHI